MMDIACSLLILPLAWLLDRLLGDPVWLPHPVVGFGKMISWTERSLNRGHCRMLKGAVVTIALDALIFGVTWVVLYYIRSFVILHFALSVLLVFYCLAGTTLMREVRQVFLALDRSLDEGRKQVARIVGRDTSELSAQEVRTAALETLAENLSDGVVAPLFWFVVGGVPAMLTYKMINTQDSMVGYRTARYRDYGCWAARIDDVANFIPARLTALLMPLALVFFSWKGGVSVLLKDMGRGFRFVHRYGRCHASPNSGYPEAALAGILDCRFGGPHYYFGQLFPKPYIGEHDRQLITCDMQKSIQVARWTEFIAVVLSVVIEYV